MEALVEAGLSFWILGSSQICIISSWARRDEKVIEIEVHTLEIKMLPRAA